MVGLCLVGHRHGEIRFRIEQSCFYWNKIGNRFEGSATNVTVGSATTVLVQREQLRRVIIKHIGRKKVNETPCIEASFI